MMFVIGLAEPICSLYDCLLGMRCSGVECHHSVTILLVALLSMQKICISGSASTHLPEMFLPPDRRLRYWIKLLAYT